jgi:hypothetical protein
MIEEFSCTKGSAGPHLALSSRDFLFVVLNLAAMEERKKVQETGSSDQIGGGRDPVLLSDWRRRHDSVLC